MEGDLKCKYPDCKMELRVTKLEDIVDEIRNELKQKSVTDAQMRQILEVIAQNQNTLSVDVKELRGELMKLVTETLNRTREDLNSFIRMQEKSEEKEKEHKRALEQLSKAQVDKERERMDNNVEKDKVFYRRLILGCVSVGATIVLAFFGIKSIIQIFY